MSVCRSPHSQEAGILEEEIQIFPNLTFTYRAGVSQVNSDDPVKDNLGDQLKEEQQKDPDLKFLTEWFTRKEEPLENILFAASPAAKYYFIKRDLFCLEDGFIWRKPKHENQEKRLVVPESLKELVLNLCHDIPSSGHQGVTKNIERTKEKFYWFGLSQAVKSYIALCEICNRNKKPNRTAPLHSSMQGHRLNVFTWISWVHFQKQKEGISTSS